MVLLDWLPPDHLWIGRNCGNSCHLSDAGMSAIQQLKRERSLPAGCGRAKGDYPNISNTWLAPGYLSSSPLTPATQSGLREQKYVRHSPPPWDSYQYRDYTGVGFQS
jgi:hypothetical protein